MPSSDDPFDFIQEDLESSEPRLFVAPWRDRKLLSGAEEIALAASLEDVLKTLNKMAHEQLDAYASFAWIMDTQGKFSLTDLQTKNEVLDYRHEPAQYNPSKHTVSQEIISQGLTTIYKHGWEYSGTLDWEEQKSLGPLLGVPIALGSNIVGGFYALREEGAEPWNDEEILHAEYLAAFGGVGLGHRGILGTTEANIVAQSHYLSAVAHDIRGPLTVIGGRVQILRANWERIEAGRRLEMLDIIGEQGGRIQRLVDTLLDMSQAEEGKLKISKEPVKVLPFLQNIVPLIAPEEQVEISTTNISPDLIFHCDKTRLEQIVANILNNSLKYGKGPRGIDLRLESNEINRDLYIEIWDKGEGLPDEIAEHLYERFQPGAKTLGLGLSIVRALVELHDGEIRYENNHPGARFIIKFKL